MSVVTVACSPEVEETPSPPTRASYSLVFPSTATAVASESIEVIAFDATDAFKNQTDCLTLVTKQKSQADLPKPPLLLARTAIAPVCELLDISGPDAGTSPGVVPGLTYGKRSLLVVVRRQGKDFLIGCGAGEISPAETTIEIPVLPFNETTVVPPTTCASLSDKCRDNCT